MVHSTLSDMQKKAGNLWQEADIMEEQIQVSARTLTTEEAIGNPEGDDFPLQRGKEKLMEATFRTFRGQAFTDRSGNFDGSLREITEMELNNNFRRGVFIATFNAVQRYLGKTDQTIHCRDKGPTLCAPQLADHIMKTYGKISITQIGYQPKIIEALAAKFTLRVIDLDPDNIGTRKCGISIEGPASTQEAINSADLIVATGSTVVNDTIDDFIFKEKPTIFYGTSVAAAADLNGLNRFCCEST